MTAVATQERAQPSLRQLMNHHADKIAAFGVDPVQYIEAAMMATVKNPDLLNCTPESVMLSLRQVAQTGLIIGHTAHLVPFKTKVKTPQGDQWQSVCTFIPDYRGLIELAVSTHKVVSIRTRCVYEGEAFNYEETIGGPVLKHIPRTKGIGGNIIGAYAIADLRFGHFKVEFMNVDEIEAIRSKSKSWKDGPLPDWYGRKTVVRKLCKTLPSNAKMQRALANDDAEPEEIPDGQFTVEPPQQVISGATRGNVISPDPYGDTGFPPRDTQAARPAVMQADPENPYNLWPDGKPMENGIA